MAFVLKKPYRLVRSTGVVARNVNELLHGLRQVSPASIFYHLYHEFWDLAGRGGKEQPANDFARWFYYHLRLKALGERLFVPDFSVDDIEEMRLRLWDMINSAAPPKEVYAPAGEEFYFLEAETVALPIGVEIAGGQQAEEIIAAADPQVVFYHLVEASLLGPREDDFCYWLKAQGEEERAEKLRQAALRAPSPSSLQQQTVEILRSRS